MRDKSYRRHVELVRKSKFRKIIFDRAKRFDISSQKSNEELLDSITGGDIGRMTSMHGVECSCPMCGNPRKYWGEKSFQEKRQDTKDK